MLPSDGLNSAIVRINAFQKDLVALAEVSLFADVLPLSLGHYPMRCLPFGE
jgi:hypothetical protein